MLSSLYYLTRDRTIPWPSTKDFFLQKSIIYGRIVRGRMSVRELSCIPVVLNLFLTTDRSTLDNFAADHPEPAVKVSTGEGGSADRHSRKCPS